MERYFLSYSVILDLVLWARSEKLGYADVGSYLNPKHEIQNPKRFGRLTALSDVEVQYLMTQFRMIITRPWRYKFKHSV